MIQHPRSQFDDSEEEQGGRSREDESTRRFDDDRALDYGLVGIERRGGERRIENDSININLFIKSVRVEVKSILDDLKENWAQTVDFSYDDELEDALVDDMIKAGEKNKDKETKDKLEKEHMSEFTECDSSELPHPPGLANHICTLMKDYIGGIEGRVASSVQLSVHHGLLELQKNTGAEASGSHVSMPEKKTGNQDVQNLASHDSLLMHIPYNLLGIPSFSLGLLHKEVTEVLVNVKHVNFVMHEDNGDGGLVEPRKSKRPQNKPIVLNDFHYDLKIGLGYNINPNIGQLFSDLQEELRQKKHISPTHTITPTEFSDIALRPQHISPKQWNVAFVLSHSYIVFYLSMINIELPNSLAMSPPYSCN
uniref:Uncharacterized protein n=1 Tax=Brassica campestris TaxID=3711 RepID=M4EMA6_BRACM